jgi:hypothetical protein
LKGKQLSTNEDGIIETPYFAAVFDELRPNRMGIDGKKGRIAMEMSLRRYTFPKDIDAMKL